MLSAADRAGGVTLPLGLGKRHWNLAFLQIPAAGAVIFGAGVRDVNRFALVVRAAVSCWERLLLQSMAAKSLQPMAASPFI